MMYFEWSDADIRNMQEMWVAGKSASEIAQALGDGLTRSAVLGKIHRLGMNFLPREATKSNFRPASNPKTTAPRIVQAKTAPRMPQPSRRHNPVPKPMAMPLITITELTNDTCRWPVGDPKTPEFRYCGARSGEALYCPSHAKLAYMPPKYRGNEQWNPMKSR